MVLAGSILLSGQSDLLDPVECTTTLGVPHGEGNLVDTLTVEATGSIDVGKQDTGKTSDSGDEAAQEATLAHGSAGGEDQSHNLGVRDGSEERGEGSVHPAAEAVANDAVGGVVAVLNLLEVGPHLVGLPAVVTSEGGNVVPVAVERRDGDEGVVAGATTEGSCTRVQNTQRLGTSGRVESRVPSAVGLLVHHLGILCLGRGVGIVVDKKVPGDLVVLGSRQVVGWDLGEDVVRVVTASINQEDLVAGVGKVGGSTTTTGARADHDKFVVLKSVVAGLSLEKRVVPGDGSTEIISTGKS